ncbi:Uncharacterized protein OS=endosymbiont of Acanthamoeba sp. UWC8 GN=I862_04430 PE=4 SV=1 [Gemmata massiliana]|uniref:Cupin 2 conserved barrel domain-containing protein n=1 Tax=Gemmata massiliana TaxID=1210884 RepID=A0A6P2D4J9_9BACT|nr:hypothetical protein [Gemmata massiliana]VTR95365.1 Uncharacterized protein OS=endosymbiont of Acanthamoeba sp. UWC8 GN=I862_04430 PE=4 SV=1 [Gemmata massiliana]
MLSALADVLESLPALLDDPTAWDSLIVNRRKPTTYRVFRYLPDGLRISLHKFDPCATHEAHPHPWPGAFALLEGSYRMWVGFTPDLESREPITVTETVLTAGSRYEIIEPRTWHSVTPLKECWTVMVNGLPWKERAHVRAPTTFGKDLEKMPRDELTAHLAKFRSLLAK